jgi:hypothetical protein
MARAAALPAIATDLGAWVGRRQRPGPSIARRAAHLPRRAGRVGLRSCWCPGCRLRRFPRPWLVARASRTWWRKNASGDAKMRQPVASRAGTSQPGCHRRCPRPAHDPRCPTPDARSAPGMPAQPLVRHPLVSPPPFVRPPTHPPPAPLGRRGHRFPRSHGPPERKVKVQWLTLRCPANPSPRTVT